jgi:limonene-1,2-epoxide hydrolase
MFDQTEHQPPCLAQLAQNLEEAAMSTPREVVQTLFNSIETMWNKKDFSGAARLFTKDATYQNVPLEPTRGGEAIGQIFQSYVEMGAPSGNPYRMRVEILAITTSESMAMVERIDHCTEGDEHLVIPVVGVFEIKDGLISAWREYFDHGVYAKIVEERKKA